MRTTCDGTYSNGVQYTPLLYLKFEVLSISIFYCYYYILEANILLLTTTKHSSAELAGSHHSCVRSVVLCIFDSVTYTHSLH